MSFVNKTPFDQYMKHSHQKLKVYSSWSRVLPICASRSCSSIYSLKAHLICGSVKIAAFLLSYMLLLSNLTVVAAVEFDAGTFIYFKIKLARGNVL